MKQFCFFLLLFMMTTGVALPGSLNDTEIPDVKRNPFVYTPKLRAYLGANVKSGTSIDKETISVSGIMDVNGKKMALVNVKGLGSIVVKPGMEVISKGETKSPTFLVKTITSTGIKIKLQNKEEIWCKYE